MLVCRRGMLPVLLIVFLIPLGAVPAVADTAQRMEVLARVGPWPVISRMIGYRGRVWFANSVKGRNHNSADLWSLDPQSGDLRYERHLFSQDAGEPLVHDGLLYWPYEDTRSSLGWGGIDVTNGEAWRFLVVPSATMFHIHGLVDWHGDLLALSSAWRAGLQLSGDRGLTWTELYDHDTEPGKVSRMSTAVVAGARLVGHLRGAGGFIRLVTWDGDVPRNVSNWTQGDRFHGLTAHGDAAYLVRTGKDGTGVWIVEGEAARALPQHKPGWQVWDLASDGARLWALARSGGMAEIWSSPDGADWRTEALLEGGEPTTLSAALGGIYVGGTGEDGHGILWGLVPERMSDAAVKAVRALPHSSGEESTVNLSGLASQLDAALAQPDSYLNHGRGVLRELVYRIATAKSSAEVLSSRFAVPLPADPVPLMGGSKTVAADRLGHWMLLWGMGLAGRGDVPVQFLGQPWDVPQHGSEKYFHPLLMTLWTVIQTGQNDDETIGALIARLEREGDPGWLTGDVVGALSALTGQRFGYNTAAWRNWWKARKGQ